jgi:hypothetical protein
MSRHPPGKAAPLLVLAPFASASSCIRIGSSQPISTAANDFVKTCRIISIGSHKKEGEARRMSSLLRTVVEV